jgi:dihydrolipoamide dehydrogenase
MYDLAVIGAGWAGFNAALKAKESGLKVCLIERGPIGGTCLNRGCIPTKSLIASAKIYSIVKKSSIFGVESDNPRFDFARIRQRADSIIRTLSQGMQSRLGGIDFVNSAAQVISQHEIRAEGQIISSGAILIATGSRPVELPQLKFDSEKVLSSDEMLVLSSLPSSLLIVGGGVIGCEFASLFSLLGVKVAILEKMPALLPGEDSEISRKIEVIFKKKGIDVFTGAELSGVSLDTYDKVLVCTGRQPNVEGLGLEKLGIKLDKKGIAVDDFLMTNIPGIYAAGDSTGRLMLAHYAAYQGITAAENISGNRRKADNLTIPACVFCDPEIASVGLNEEKAASCGIAVKTCKFDFRASAMGRIIDETEGFIKVVVGKDSEEVVGGCIIGPKATELISALTMAVSLRLKLNDMRKVIFAHPTLSESLRDAVK